MFDFTGNFSLRYFYKRTEPRSPGLDEGSGTLSCRVAHRPLVVQAAELLHATPLSPPLSHAPGGTPRTPRTLFALSVLWHMGSS